MTTPVNITRSFSNLPTVSTNLGGPYTGYSPQQTQLNYKDSGSVMTRRVLRDGWNNQYAGGIVNGISSAIGPFRRTTNSGDFLSRINYVCGGPNPSNLKLPGIGNRFGSLVNNCDNTGIPASSCNGRYVPDASDYTTFKKQLAIQQNYNDLANGGDQSNASFVARLGIRRH